MNLPVEWSATASPENRCPGRVLADQSFDQHGDHVVKG